VKKIPLTRGKVAFVDDRDFALVSHFKWRAGSTQGGKFYRAITYVCGHLISMHRLILNCQSAIDHRNGNPLDNRRRNLRRATHSQNAANCKKWQRATSSKYKGVTRHKKRNRWVAQIGVNGRRLYLGSFADERAAAEAYDQAARKFFGGFARLNFPLQRKGNL
jgi:hypothetical protein